MRESLGVSSGGVSAVAVPPLIGRESHDEQLTRGPMNLQEYLPVILFILVGVGVGIVPQVIGFVFGPNRPDSAKNSPYECGFEAFEDARMKFDVRYYLVAILFILFDLEIAFLFPWAVALHDIGATGFWAMMVFLGILVVGFVYEWKKGALDWE
jgi:NADH-quinone oxidoreductase subunit A